MNVICIIYVYKSIKGLLSSYGSFRAHIYHLQMIKSTLFKNDETA